MSIWSRIADRGRPERRKKRKAQEAAQEARERRAEARVGKRRLQDAPQPKRAGASAGFARMHKGIVGRQNDFDRFRTLTEGRGRMSWNRRRTRRIRQEQNEARNNG